MLNGMDLNGGPSRASRWDDQTLEATAAQGSALACGAYARPGGTR